MATYVRRTLVAGTFFSLFAMNRMISDIIHREKGLLRVKFCGLCGSHYLLQILFFEGVEVEAVTQAKVQSLINRQNLFVFMKSRKEGGFRRNHSKN
jgi:hypothetical protein